MAKGIFVAFEGPDGGGKSTQAFRLKAHLDADGRDVIFVREPGGTELGEQVRSILLDPALTTMTTESELFLFMAARAQLISEVIRPGLERGAVVISDRFLLSTLVYQGVVGGLPLPAVQEVGKMATGGLKPDLTLILDVPAAVGLSRVGKEQDRIEQKGEEFFCQIREGYQLLAADDPKACLIDATQEPTAVADEIWDKVQHVLS
jgi:dTMP kinase